MKDTEVNWKWIIPPCLRKATEASSVAGESLYGGLERSVHEIVKVKPGLHWRSYGIGGARPLGYLQGNAADKERT